MKWKFILLRQTKLGLMGLLPMVMAMTCQRNAPRYEPDLIVDQEAIETPAMGLSTIQKTSKMAAIANDANPYGLLLEKLPTCCKGSRELKKLLDDINYKASLILDMSATTDHYLQNDFSTLIASDLAIINHNTSTPSNRLPNSLNNSAKHSFSLIGFLICKPVNNSSKKHLIAFVKTDQTWFYYQDDGTKVPLSTQEAMYLASARGTTLFFRKIT